VLKWLREQGCPWDKYTCIQAAYYDHYQVVIWAKVNGCPTDEEVIAENERYKELEARTPSMWGH